MSKQAIKEKAQEKLDKAKQKLELVKVRANTQKSSSVKLDADTVAHDASSKKWVISINKQNHTTQGVHLKTLVCVIHYDATFYLNK